MPRGEGEKSVANLKGPVYGFPSTIYGFIYRLRLSSVTSHGKKVGPDTQRLMGSCTLFEVLSRQHAAKELNWGMLHKLSFRLSFFFHSFLAFLLALISFLSEFPLSS